MWKQVLCYIFRSQRIDETTERPAYQLTGRQASALLLLQHRLQEFRQWKSRPEALAAELEADGIWTSDAEVEEMEKIQKAILALCMSLLDHSPAHSECKSALISGLAVLAIDEHGGWLSAENYTSKYSAIVKLARLLVVHSAYLKVDSSIQRCLDQGYSQEQAQAQTGGYIECIWSAMMQFMVLGQPDQLLPTPIHWTYHTRTYGMKVRHTTAAAGVVQWERHSVLYQHRQPRAHTEPQGRFPVRALH